MNRLDYVFSRQLWSGRNWSLTISKQYDFVHCIKNYWMFQHTVVVELSKVLDLGDASLGKSEVVLL